MAYSSASIISSTSALLTFLIFFLSIRFLARHRSTLTTKTSTSGTSGVGSDDWIALLAGLGSSIGCLLILVSANEALGRTTLYANPSQLKNVLLLIWLDQINYLIVMGLTKASTLLLYIRIFHAETGEQKRFRKICWDVVGIVFLTSFFLIIFAIIMCDPVSYFWTRVIRPEDGKCKDHRPYLYANTIISIVTDMVVVVLPMRQILSLHMSRKKKVTVLGLFGLGLVVIICSIMRATKVEDAAKRTDPMIDLSGLCIWSLVESVVGVICCCIPACHRLIKDFFVDILLPEKTEEAVPAHTIQPHGKSVTRQWDVESEVGATGSLNPGYRRSPAVDSRW